MKPLVYLAGPYSDEPMLRTHQAIVAGDRIAELGFAVIIPHLSHFWHAVRPKTYEFWMDQDLEMLARCDALLRLPGDSPGADREVAFAVNRGMRVFYSERSLVDWRDKSFFAATV
jgi:nucleoside 2-deoxyribosyltransferase